MMLTSCRPWLYAGNPQSLVQLGARFSTLSSSNIVQDSGNQQGSPDNQVGQVPGNFNSVNTNFNSTNQDALGYWLAGFIEGEGSFNVCFKLNTNLRTGIDVVPEISVTQHVNGISVLQLLKATLGGIGTEVKPKEKNSNVYAYRITKLDELLNVAIPFLQKYNPYSARKNEFNMVVTICEMKRNKQHLTDAGLLQIIDLVFDTPLKKANRQYSKADLLSVLGDKHKVHALQLSRRKNK